MSASSSNAVYLGFSTVSLHAGMIKQVKLFGERPTFHGGNDAPGVVRIPLILEAGVICFLCLRT